MTILALDQSSKTSGYSVFKDNKLFTYGKFTYSDTDIGKRLMKIRKKIVELIIQYNPDHVIFEDIQLQENVGNNVQTFKALAEVYGVISELLTSSNISHSTVMATSWKHTIGIKGRSRAEQKRNAQKYVLEKYGKQPTEDESDAICIGESYILKSSINSNDWSV